jgi:DNA-binding beta-propeller fold protein YncE
LDYFFWSGIRAIRILHRQVHSHYVSVTGLSTSSAIATMRVGSEQSAATVTPEDDPVFVSNQAVASVSVMDSAARTVIETNPLSGLCTT